MPRALLLFEFPTLNGGERSLFAAMPSLQRAGWHFDAFAPPTGPLAAALQKCGIRLPLPTVEEVPKAGGETLSDVLAAQRYDIVHANSLSTGRKFAAMIAAAGVPSIAHLRDIVGLKPAAVAELNRHTRLLGVSQATADFHAAQGVDRAKLHVAYNGVDLADFRPSSTATGRRTIGVIGQIILRKGQDVALAAAVDVLQSRPDADVAVIGSRHSDKQETQEYEARLHKIVADAGMTDRVRFLGTRDDVAALLPTWTLLLHTPRQEPLGRVLLEAGACGVAVVATDVGGTREIFPRGEADGALIVPVDDVTTTVAAVGRILDDPALAATLGAAGRRRIESAFTIDRAAAELLRHYDEVAQTGYNRREP